MENIKELKIKKGSGDPVTYSLGAVTGIKGSEEEAFRDGDVEITASNIGLGNVDNTRDSQKTVAQANKVTHPLTFANGQSYDGSADMTIDKNAVGLDKVENNTPDEILKQMTNEQVTAALGYVPASGENLVLDSGVEITNSNYMIHEYKLSEPFELNTTYTITIWGELGEDKTGFIPFIGNGSNSLIGKLIEKSDRVYSGTVYRNRQWLDTADRTKLLIYVGPNEAVVNSVIRKIKLERGTVTDPVWTPAPEDTVTYVKDNHILVIGTNN